MLRPSWMIRSTFTPAPRVFSYRVTVGPRVKPVTAQSTPNSRNTCCRAEMTASLALVLAFAGVPAASSVEAGRV